ncbi:MULTISPECIES: hypothetical protein [unclassified Variovorax]|uniref:hypothetical protein n=1 Tax=unclassified Variovorax TaxID=663243 RepID=UPI00257699A1|nr:MULTISPECIES: hypothetical protein [unclassified Variovorax]MDM0086970.1 hypothetical protein [Variovorax sp. J22G40]MDM0144773.1 hypothetical protein [Variovorax sp. J2P1-31]
MTRKHLNFPPPPVPRTVRELLKDYPELIEELQDGLTKSHYGPLGALNFDSAIWLLKDMLGGDLVDAHEQSDQAKARGDQETVRRADEKAMAIAMARLDASGDGDLSSYFKTYEKDFQ